jgi:hypothetical protein
MSLTKSIQSLAAVSAILATATAGWAGCNCNVPPSPAAYSGSPAMNAGYGGYSAYTAYGGYGGMQGANYGASPYGGGVYVPGMTPGQAGPGVGYGGAGAPYDPSMMPYGGMVATNGPHWAPGGYEPRIGSPAYYYDPTGGQYVVTGNPYSDHFGPGFQRSQVHGHYRFPYYNYRAPWYYPGRAVYNRNTNFAW